MNEDEPIKIDKDVEMPVVGDGTLRRGPRSRWPFREMEVGDSFMAPDQTKNEVMRLRQAVNSFHVQTKREAERAGPDTVPVTMLLDKDKKGVWRVWRVK